MIIFIIPILIFLITKLIIKKSKVLIKPATAGNVQSQRMNNNIEKKVDSYKKFMIDDKIFYFGDFDIYYADGDSMIKEGIHSGDCLLVKPFKNKEDKSKKLKKGDIIVINHGGENGHEFKLRLFDHLEGEFVFTNKYVKDPINGNLPDPNNEKYSLVASKPHNVKHIVGKLKYSFPEKENEFVYAA